MNAEIISIGTELLLGQIVDTNAVYITKQLAELGINVFFKTTVGDNRERLIAVLQQAYARADLVVTTGGLGPTVDDLTVETIAEYWQEELVEDADSLQKIADFCALRGVALLANNRKQAFRPKGAQLILNPLGTAPGMILEKNGRITISLPGVPMEMYRMFTETVVPYLRGKQGGVQQVIQSRNLKFVGIGESMLEERIRDLMAEQTNPTIAPYAKSCEVHLRLTAKADNPEKALQLISDLQEIILKRVGEYFYGCDEETLEEIAAKLLQQTGCSLAVAESCSGGLIAHRLTNVPGISAFLDRGVVSYSNTAKREMLGVREATLATYGAVSQEVACEMAEGIKRVSKTDVGLAVTGIAGPDGGSKQKPVGLVFLALAGQGETVWQECHFYGDRAMVKNRTAQTALAMLKKYLEKWIDKQANLQ